MDLKQRRGVGQRRKTLNFSLPVQLEEFIKDKAERSHGGNVSHYIRTLVVADYSKEQLADREAEPQLAEVA